MFRADEREAYLLFPTPFVTDVGLLFGVLGEELDPLSTKGSRIAGGFPSVIAHGMLRGRVFLPVHWGLFTLALHTWTEPVERVRAGPAQLETPER